MPRSAAALPITRILPDRREIMAGAMAPTGLAGAIAVTLAEAMAGMAFLQLVKPGAPVIFGSFVTTLSMQSGAPTYGTPETSLMKSALMALARRLGVPSRTGGSLCASKIADAQAAYESSQTLMTTVMGGASFVLQSAGWLEGGLVEDPGAVALGSGVEH